ncbi:hypothetical protein [Bacillus sp. FJAT-44742]|uniref:hypothetical protein n=1 Tax=Bacillus sp. FJAT-44742 TaxID=2014005 RepID=UPI000C23976F|nr:hypothetical protein [Bacillus sp. FJAT-44742]
MDYFYEYGWLLFLAAEVLTWGTAMALFYSRYFLSSRFLTRVSIVSILALTAFQLYLVGVDYYINQEVSFTQVLMLLFIFYAATFGKSYISRLDGYMKQKFENRDTSWKTYLPFSLKIQPEQKRQQWFYLHTAVFFSLHLLLLPMTNSSLPTWEWSFYTGWMSQPHLGFYPYHSFNIFSYVWRIIYMIDVFFFLCFSYFPLLVQRLRSRL